LRILISKKLLTLDQTTALIQIEENQGSVLISDNQIPQFIHDFNLLLPDVQNTKNDSHSISEHILNEIRISLDFYNRQATTHQKKHVEQIYLFTNQQAKEISQTLQADLNIKTTSLEINDLFPYQNELHPNMASAIGASLASTTSLGFDLNLAKSRKTIGTQQGKTAANLEHFLAKPPNYKITAVMAIIFLLIVGASLGTAYLRLSPQEKRLSELTTFSQEYQKASTETLKKLIQDTTNKIAVYKTLRFQSHLTAYLDNISKSILEGVWLTDLEITYPEEAAAQKQDQMTANKISVTLNGYSYNEELDQQISLIEKFLGKLKVNSFLKTHTKQINLKQVKKETLDEFPVTFFQIMMEAEDSDG
jgi:hypothetical protein